MAEIKSASDLVAEMLSAMKVADPQLDTSIGSVSRKIFDVVAEQVAPAYAIGYLQDWIYSIDSKAGAALDDYVSQFGIERIPAKRATGLVTFSRDKVATVNIPVPLNTAVITGSSPRLTFATSASAFLLKGTKQVTVPVQAVNAGASGNLPVGSIISLAAGVGSIKGAVLQADATTGGTDAESDAALRQRFRSTIFRSIAGTEDMYLGLALEDSTPDDDFDKQALQAVVIGPTKRWREQVQIASGSATSSIPAANASYIYDASAILGENIDIGSILTQGVHYDFVSSTNPPSVSTISTNLENGGIYDLDYEYVSTASRNNPNQGITNRVDIWVSGVYPEIAREVTYWRPVQFSSITTDPMWWGNFIRTDPNVGFSRPTTNNYFLQLAWGPIVEFPQVLTINGVTYTNGVDFWVVHDESAQGLSPRSRFGLEFKTTKVPPANQKIILSGNLSPGTSYYYNRLPADIEARSRRWKLLTTDVMVHQARVVRLILNFAIMYSASYTRGSVQASVDSAMSNWIKEKGFSSQIQVSDLLQVAHNVPGVDNIRFLTSTEPMLAPDDTNSWGIQVVNEDGRHISHLATTGAAPLRAKDWVFQDNQVPVIYDIRYQTKATNTFGAQ